VNDFVVNLASQLAVAAIVGGAGVYTTFVVLGKRVDQLEKENGELRDELVRHAEVVAAKADADAVAVKHAELEGRMRTQDLQLNGLSVAMSEVKTDVRWIRETLEKRERGVR
jgi:hypothetical protein